MISNGTLPTTDSRPLTPAKIPEGDRANQRETWKRARVLGAFPYGENALTLVVARYPPRSRAQNDKLQINRPAAACLFATCLMWGPDAKLFQPNNLTSVPRKLKIAKKPGHYSAINRILKSEF